MTLSLPRFNLKKYFYSFKVVFLLGASSPVRFLGWFFADALLLFAFYLLFDQLFKQKPIVEGFTFTTFFTYYAITMVVKKITTSINVVAVMRTDIKSGSFSSLLLRPINPALYISTQFFSRRSVEFIFPVSLIVFLFIFFPEIIVRPVHPFFFLFSFFLGIILGQLFYFIIGTIAFWVTETWGYMSILNRTVGLLGGNIVPLDLLPGIVISISMYLPFKYMHYVPIMIYLGRYSQIEIYQQLLFQFITICILFVLYKFFWSIGIKRYGAVGN